LSSEKKINYDILLDNLFYISSLSRYNSERSLLITDFYNEIIKNKKIFQQVVIINDIKDYISRVFKNFSIFNFHSKYIDDIPVVLNFDYLYDRYGYLSNEFFQEFGFRVFSLLLTEIGLKKAVGIKANEFGIATEVYQYNNGYELSDPSFIKEPSDDYKEKWKKSITVNRNDVFNIYINDFQEHLVATKADTAIHLDRQIEEDFLKESKKEFDIILEFLMNKINKIQHEDFHSIMKPILTLNLQKSKDDFQILIPFPELLLTSTNIRIESLIKHSRVLSKLENDNKGKIVEFLVSKILLNFPNRNIIKNYTFLKQGAKYENDLLLILKNSLWIAEIKSHPIFRKFPNEVEKFIPKYIKSVQKGYEQGKRGIIELAKEIKLLRSINSKKIYKNLEKGVIIVLDGFIPTFFTQNKKQDQELKTDILYNFTSNSLRIYVISLLDLYIISKQYDKENFENFLLWRTSLLGKFPVFCFNEREYWAFFHDRFPEMKDDKGIPFANHFDKFAKNNNIIHYISKRFNDKTYATKIREKQERDQLLEHLK